MNSYTFLASGLDGLARGGLYAAMALGLSLVFGVMRFVNVAHAELLVLSAFLVFALAAGLGLSPLIAMLIVAPAMFVLGYAMQRVIINPLMNKGVEPALLTAFGISIILQNLMLMTWGGNTRSLSTGLADLGFDFGPYRLPALTLLGLVVGVTLTVGAHLFFKKSALGRAFRAASQDPATARVMGINVDAVYGLTAGIAAATAAIGGALIGMTLSFTPVAGFTWLLKGFVIVILGGMGSIIGTLVGGLILGLSEGLGGAVFGTGYRDMIGYLIFLVILMVRPSGLFGVAGSEK
ncbi:MAG: branched-chain amino acid ABC transporter permease [Maritimibacter sp.]|nr:branched-chain amino acid ABC transporter permease [Maritimibacter sp.]